ncbi:MAG: TRAP-type C4-dicarboxylate transport system permease small subunit [Oceanospirillaceae bacterium]|jgi:TRAP-type C4-dicarboxylate transport system permease small subunit
MTIGGSLRYAERNIEKFIILISYGSMAGIIFVEVIRRFFFNQQAPWSTTIPIYLFLWLTWMGASYNTMRRSHLRFSEFRERFSYRAKFYCLLLDAICWFALGIIVIFYAVQQVYISYDNFAIVQGTDDVMQWWFYMATPVAWGLLLVRVLQNLKKDITDYRAGLPLVTQAALFD